MKTVCDIALLAILVLPLWAADEPTKLKCVTEDGKLTADVTIDLVNKRMTWGVYNYTITNVTDKFISAYQEHSDIGGETWVLDRVTGKYVRAFIGMLCDENGKNCSLAARVYRGVCTKGVI